MEMEIFVKQHAVEIESEEVGTNPNFETTLIPMRHYRVTLTALVNYEAREMVTYFSMSRYISHEPEVSEVLSILALEASGFDNARDKKDWALDYGYDDPFETVRIYAAVGKNAGLLKEFLGDEAYEVLLYQVEPL